MQVTTAQVLSIAHNVAQVYEVGRIYGLLKNLSKKLYTHQWSKPSLELNFATKPSYISLKTPSNTNHNNLTARHL